MRGQQRIEGNERADILAKTGVKELFLPKSPNERKHLLHAANENKI